MQKEGSESQIESLNDCVEAVQVCYEAARATNVEDLFSDEQAAVLLSMVHRAKGLEYDRVFILKPDKLPLPWPNQREWEEIQEYHLRYVALTRARQELYFVHSDE